MAHAASIVSCRFSPCGKFIVSGSTDGAVIIWKVPEVNQNNMNKKKNAMSLFKLNVFLQKYWPKPNADPLNVSSIESVKKKFSKYEKRPEDIKHAELNRLKKDLQIFECPPIKVDTHTPTSHKSMNSSSNNRKN